eukprot:6035520-Pyramimonas_sp.AAC.1
MSATHHIPSRSDNELRAWHARQGKCISSVCRHFDDLKGSSTTTAGEGLGGVGERSWEAQQSREYVHVSWSSTRAGLGHEVFLYLPEGLRRGIASDALASAFGLPT